MATPGDRPERAGSTGRFVAPLGLLAIVTGCAEPAHVERDLEVFGGPSRIELHASSARVAESAAEEMESALRRAERLFATDPDGELGRINAAAGSAPTHVPDGDLYHCAKVALDWSKASEGAFDPTLGTVVRLHAAKPTPSPEAVASALAHTGWGKVKLYPEARAIRFLDPELRLDLGGIREGYALDIVARNFARVGVEAGLLSAGGVTYAWEPPRGEASWRVAVRDSGSDTPLAATVALSHGALSVSGSFAPAFDGASPAARRILDPATGWPVEGDVLAAVAISAGAADADALSTAMFVMGAQRAAGLLERGAETQSRRVEALLLIRDRDDGDAYLLASASLRERLELDPGFAAAIGRDVRFLLPPVAPRP